MKKIALLLVVAISMGLVLGVSASNVANKTAGHGKGNNNSWNSQNKTIKATMALRGHKNKTARWKNLSAALDINCSSANKQEWNQCRKQRMGEIRVSYKNCTAYSNKSDCVVDRRRERWQLRVEGIEGLCAQNVSSACRQRLNMVRECMNETPGPDRAECAKNKLRLGKAVSQLVRECRNTTNTTEQGKCIENVTQNVYAYATMKMEDLADRAEMLLGLGVNETAVNDFASFVDDSVQAFGEAGTIAGKKDIILEVRHAWQDLMNVAKKSI